MRSVDGHRRHNVFSFQTEIHKRDKRKPMSQMMHSTKGKEKRFLNRSESRMVLTVGKATIHLPVLHPCPMKKSFARALEHSTINTVNRTFAAPARRASSFMGFKKSYNLPEKEKHLPTIVFQDCVSESTDCIAEGSDSKRPDSTNSHFYTMTSGTKHENLPRRTVETSENLDKHIRPKIVNLRPWENDKLKSSKKTTVFDTQDTERERNIACLMNWLIEYNAKQQEADGLRTQSGQNKNECGDQELRTEQAILSCAGATRCVNDADRNWLTGVLLISSNIAPNSKNFVQFLPKMMRPSLHLKNGLIVEGKFSGHTLPVLKKDNKMCLKNHRRTNHKTLKQQEMKKTPISWSALKVDYMNEIFWKRNRITNIKFYPIQIKQRLLKLKNQKYVIVNNLPYQSSIFPIILLPLETAVKEKRKIKSASVIGGPPGHILGQREWNKINRNIPIQRKVMKVKDL